MNPTFPEEISEKINALRSSGELKQNEEVISYAEGDNEEIKQINEISSSKSVKVMSFIAKSLEKMTAGGIQLSGNTILLLTNRRIIALYKMFTNTYEERMAFYDYRTHFDYNNNTIRLKLSTGELMEFVIKDSTQIQHFTQAVEILLASGKTNTQSSNIPEQIKQLSELKNQGIITEEEFQIKKQQLLEKM